MLEEEAPGASPMFTAAAYDTETLSALRESASAADGEGATRSIQSPTFQQEALAPGNSFSPAPAEVFTTTAAENGLEDATLWSEGTVEERVEMGGYDTIQLSTEAGEVYVSAVTIPLEGVSVGDEVVVYFLYSGWSETLGGAAGVYVYHE